MMSNSSATSRWYLVQCRPRQELRAEQNLRNQYFSCYCPQHSVEKMRDGKRAVTQQPLFPGYLFINLCKFSDNWHSIRSTRGVLRLVTFAGEPLPVGDEVISDLQERLAKVGSQPLFREGMPVTLIEGPFKDMNAVFCKADGDERAVILLDLLSRKQRMKVPVRALSVLA